MTDTIEIDSIELDGEQAHHFEFIRDHAEDENGETPTPEDLAKQLLGQKATEEYIKAMQGGNQQQGPMR